MRPSVRALALALLLAAGSLQAQTPGEVLTPTQVTEWERLEHEVLANLLAQRAGDALTSAQQLLALTQRNLPPLHPRMAVALWRLALARIEMRQTSLAEEPLRQALAISDRLPAPLPAGTLARMLGPLADLCVEETRMDEAAALYTRAIGLMTPPPEDGRRYLARLQNDLGLLYVIAGQPQSGEPLLRSALAAREDLAAGKPEGSVVQSLNALALGRSESGDHEGALAFQQRALAVAERLPARQVELVGLTLNGMALSLLRLERMAEAEPIQRRALAVLEAPAQSAYRPAAQGMITLAKIQRAAGKLDEAAALAARSLELRETLMRADDSRIVESLELLADIEQQRGNDAKAQPLRERLQGIRSARQARSDDPLARPASYLQPPQVDYPEDARARRYEGRVMLRVVVDAQGQAAFVTVVDSSGYGSLDEAARRAVLGMKFTPAARRSGAALPSVVQLPVEFKLPPS